MTEEFVNLRSRKNPKARIKLMGGHFATMNSHVNTYIDMSEKYRSDRRIYGRTSGGYRQDFHECRK